MFLSVYKHHSTLYTQVLGTTWWPYSQELKCFPKALQLMQMCQDYFEEEYTTEKLQSRPAFARKYRNIFADLPCLLLRENHPLNRAERPPQFAC